MTGGRRNGAFPFPSAFKAIGKAVGIFQHSARSHLGQRTLLPHCAFLHPWCLCFQAVKNQSQTELVDEEAMSQIRKGHETMCVVLTSRHKNLDTVRAVWSTGDIKARTWRPVRLGVGVAKWLLCLF